MREKPTNIICLYFLSNSLTAFSLYFRHCFCCHSNNNNNNNNNSSSNSGCCYCCFVVDGVGNDGTGIGRGRWIVHQNADTRPVKIITMTMTGTTFVCTYTFLGQ